jgi:glucose uptake protein GlcU
MKITYRDVVATLLVAAIVVPYIGYLAWGDIPFIQDPRGMAATGLVLGLAAAAVAGRSALHPDPMHRAALGSGVAALALGIAALWAETNEVLLALFIVAIVVTWMLGEIAHARGSVAAGRSMAHHG